MVVGQRDKGEKRFKGDSKCLHNWTDDDTLDWDEKKKKKKGGGLRNQLRGKINMDLPSPRGDPKHLVMQIWSSEEISIWTSPIDYMRGGRVRGQRWLRWSGTGTVWLSCRWLSHPGC